MEILKPAIPRQAIAETERSYEPEQRRLKGSLELYFERNSASCRTRLARSVQAPPLRVVRAFERDDGSALAHLHNVSGGILGGDALALRVTVGSGARVQLTTTGATRIYRLRPGAAPAIQTNEIVVAEDGLLEYVPDAIIPFSGACFCQQTRIHLARGAGLFWWEILAPGREARGENFEYTQVELSTDVMAQGRLIAAERLRIEPRERDPRSVVRLGRFRYLASFLICRAGIGADVWRAAEQHLRETVRATSPPEETAWGISTLAADGLAVRGLALRGRDAQAGLHAIWRAAKSILYGTEPIPPRKVN